MPGKGFDIGPLGFDDEKKPDPRRPPPSEDGYSPWEDLSGEGWKPGTERQPPSEGLLSALKETAERDFDETFRALVVKFLWDMFWSFVKPSKGAIDSVVQQVVKIGVEQVLEQYNAGGPLDEDSINALEQAANDSIDRFLALYSEPMLNKEFMAATSDAFKKGLKK